jgi:hypothetical protein
MSNTATGPLSTLVSAVEAARRILKVRPPAQGPLTKAINTTLFVAHTQNLPSLRGLHAILGDRMRLFGGEALTSFNDARAIMAREPEKIDWFSGPLQDRADYLTKGYMPFLMKGPNHTLRREHIMRGIARAHRKLAELEVLLDQEVSIDHAITRFLFRHLCGVELEPTEVDWFLDFKRRAQPLVLLPKLVRSTVLKRQHEALQARRLYFLQRIEAQGEPIADSWFDVIWFNAGTLGFYPQKALEALEANPALEAAVRDELALSPDERVRTRALIHEVLRIHGKIASTNYVEEDRVKIALLATAVVDPARYDDPLKIDLSRDHSDTLVFSGPAPTRKCPAELFAPDLMATVVAQRVRSGVLGRAQN